MPVAELRDEAGDLGEPVRRQGLEPLSPCGRGQRVAQGIGDRAVGERRLGLAAAGPDNRDALCSQAEDCVLHESRLADPRLALHHDDPAGLDRPAQRLSESSQFVHPAYERIFTGTHRLRA